MAKRAKRAARTTSMATAMPSDEMPAPRVSLEGEPARPFLGCDPGQRVTVELTGKVRRVGLDKRLISEPGRRMQKRERPEVDIEVQTARLVSKAGRKEG